MRTVEAGDGPAMGWRAKTTTGDVSGAEAGSVMRVGYKSTAGALDGGTTEPELNATVALPNAGGGGSKGASPGRRPPYEVSR